MFCVRFRELSVSYGKNFTLNHQDENEETLSTEVEETTVLTLCQRCVYIVLQR